ncbi:MAG: 3-deoxy-7-phosphoheptulonate synthase [Candidatus Wildermuthbacteria bacterium]|nr:3-deoxy-7-phosphoheptulonate synthase [Candidatus Wildermuthbacteria bacterium]
MAPVKKIIRGSKPLENANIAEVVRLESPVMLKQRLPAHSAIKKAVLRGRRIVENILKGVDQRLLVIVGPCSIHDPVAALDYAEHLKELAEQVQDKMFVVMRMYFEKPRTTTGWQGFLRDPHLDGSFDAPFGLTSARELLLRLLGMGVLPATEFVDLITPQYIDDLVVWGAIGARSAEAQAYRNLASGLGMPVGFKNGTGGSIQLAVNGVVAANHPSPFFGIDQEGFASLFVSTGNPACHIVLRGSSKGPNYEEASVKEAERLLGEAGVAPRFVIDCSHDNSGKDHTRQPLVFQEVLRQRINGNPCIAGVMLESHLHEGKQSLNGNAATLKYGVSITDSCIGWEQTVELLLEAHRALSGDVLATAKK